MADSIDLQATSSASAAVLTGLAERMAPFEQNVASEAGESDLDTLRIRALTDSGQLILVPVGPILARAVADAIAAIPVADWTPIIEAIAEAKLAEARADVPLTVGLAAGRYELEVLGDNSKQWVPAAPAAGTPPSAPTIDDVETDNVVTAVEAADGVTISGTAEADSTVSVSWGGVNKSTTADGSGDWSVSYAAGEIPAPGSTTVSATATNADGTSPAATKAVTVQAGLVPVVSGGYQVTDTEYARLYGPGTLVMDYIANHHAGTRTGGGGGTEHLCSLRFRAPHSGYVDKIQFFLPYGTGYSGGTGGTARLRIFPDDGTANHRPDMSGSPLGTGARTLAWGGADGAAYLYPEVTMSRDAQLVAGNVYHVVFDNTDGSPQTNFYSVDTAASVFANGRGMRWLSPVDWGALRGTRTPYGSGTRNWLETTIVPYNEAGDNDYRTPLMKVTMAGGEVFGNTDNDSGNNGGRQWDVGSSTSWTTVRERFIPSANRKAVGFSVMTGASTGGDLLVELKNSGGSVLASATITQSTANAASSGVATLTWYDALFDAPVDLTSGQTYYLQFTPQESSVWIFADEQNGAMQGFSHPVAFTESQAQHFHAGSWKGAYHYDHTDNGTGSNWRVVLHAA